MPYANKDVYVFLYNYIFNIYVSSSYIFFVNLRYMFHTYMLFSIIFSNICKFAFNIIMVASNSTVSPHGRPSKSDIF